MARNRKSKTLTFGIDDKEREMLNECIRIRTINNIGEISVRGYFTFLLEKDYEQLTSKKEVMRRD